MSAESSDKGLRAPRVSSGEGRLPRGRGATVRVWIRDIVIVAGLYLGLSLYQTRHVLERGVEFPELELRSLEGSPTRLSSYRGRAVMVHVWATWCSVCRREFGSVAALAAAPPRNAAVVTIVMDGEDARRIGSFVRQHDILYPVLLGSEDLSAKLGVHVFPTTYYLDREGSVSSATVGMSLRWVMWLRLWWAA